MCLFPIAIAILTSACLGKRLAPEFVQASVIEKNEVDDGNHRLDVTSKSVTESQLDLERLESQLTVALDLKATLLKTPFNMSLQKQLDDILGEVEFANENEKVSLLGLSDHPSFPGSPSSKPTRESASILAQLATSDDATTPTTTDHMALLGSIAEPGSSIRVATSQPYKSLKKALARLAPWSNRHDFALEDFADGNPKYMIKGVGVSTHQRMYLAVPGEKEPRFAIYLTFSRLNPIGMIFGQWVYRVIPYHKGDDKFKYNVKDSVLTITRDRLGRGLFWARAEWRVYTGDGGCRLIGLVSCNKEQQIYYALSQGAGDLLQKHDLIMFEGPISAISHGHTAKLYNGTTWEGKELEGHIVAESEQLDGVSRLLSWLIPVGGQLIFPPVALLWGFAQHAFTDAYKLTFKKSVDEALFGVVMALQSISVGDTRNRVAITLGSTSR